MPVKKSLAGSGPGLSGTVPGRAGGASPVKAAKRPSTCRRFCGMSQSQVPAMPAEDRVSESWRCASTSRRSISASRVRPASASWTCDMSTCEAK